MKSVEGKGTGGVALGGESPIIAKNTRDYAFRTTPGGEFALTEREGKMRKDLREGEKKKTKKKESTATEERETERERKQTDV